VNAKLHSLATPHAILAFLSLAIPVTVHLITGGAGFVGVNLAARLRGRGDRILLVDNLSRGRRANLGALHGDEGVRLAVADCADRDALLMAVASAGLEGRIEEVWHLAANSDIAAGGADLHVDMRDTLMTTTGVLETMRALGLTSLNFASSSAVYGDLGGRAVTEADGPLEPISNYGAMKLASEAQIRAACETFLDRANIFRFANVVGVPATHGVILDFVRKLTADPHRLQVLGDGAQQKPYLHVGDLVDAMLALSERLAGGFNLVNVGPDDDGITVREIAEATAAAVSPQARIEYGTTRGGWPGDVPRFRYATDKARSLGWRCGCSSQAAVRRAVAEIVEQEEGSLCRR
jgi:UDP-glucose 4-epimerase